MQVKKHSAANQKTTFEGTEGSKYTKLIIHFGSLRAASYLISGFLITFVS